MRLQPVTVSIVIYKTRLSDVYDLFTVLRSHELVESWVVVDNDASDAVREAVEEAGGIYVRTGKNIGFGAGHNVALKFLDSSACPYHIILNPDIKFDGSRLERLIEVMELQPDIGLLMPKVVYPDGRNQYLCKLLPTPADLLLRRFLPRRFSSLARKRTARYELHSLDYNAPAYVPSLSGCFMLLRMSVLKAVGGFDERFFLYMEDVDLCRRISTVSRLLYWPGVTVEHTHQMGSYRSKKLLFLHIRSAIQYFNKWGWVVDTYRGRTNRIALAEVNNRQK